MTQITCALCNEKREGKTNTHYLTDSIIKRCLNHDGSTTREKGYMFAIDPHDARVNFEFQKEATNQALEAYNRELTDEEIEDAKSKIAYSVDNIFCAECEHKFTQIETAFLNQHLSAIRGTSDGREYFEISDNGETRLFFLLQVWRSHVCDPNFSITETVAENLRVAIDSYPNDFHDRVKDYPLHVVQLHTPKCEESGKGEFWYYTQSKVGYFEGENPAIVLMCDFIIQLYNSVEEIKYYDCYGLNEETFQSHINANEEAFRIELASNDRRENFLQNLADSDGSAFVKSLVKKFATLCNELNVSFTQDLVSKYLKHITDGDYHPLKYTDENIVLKTSEFLQQEFLR